MLGLLLLIVPHDTTQRVTCDIQEWNVVYDLAHDEPRHRLSQLIIRDLGEIRDWRIERRPERDWVRGGYTTRWIENGQMIEVRSPVLVESVTEFDREVIERDWLPEASRRRVNK